MNLKAYFQCQRIYCLHHLKLLLRSDGHEDSSDSDEIGVILKRIYKLIPHKITRNLYLLRNLRIFDREYLYIVKPNKNRDWTRTAALNDADNIFFDIESKLSGSSKI